MFAVLFSIDKSSNCKLTMQLQLMLANILWHSEGSEPWL